MMSSEEVLNDIFDGYDRQGVEYSKGPDFNLRDDLVMKFHARMECFESHDFKGAVHNLIWDALKLGYQYRKESKEALEKGLIK